MAKVNTRIQSKHDVEKNWANATFAPLPGEIIIYDKDKGIDGGTHEKPRIKVGDGTTAVGSLPFVVDKEATDAAIAEVDATVQGAIKDVSVSGKVLTFTKVDGSTVTATTQDTNTDTKVTNTKANTTKAYVTGTTNSATNTGTQVFDTGVYLGTEAGSLHATKFVGNAMKDDLGNTISTTYETQADATEKLSTAKSYTDTKTANMNKDAYLTWGGQNKAGGIGPVGAALSAEHSANRLAYLNPAALSFETSNDGGSTWTSLSLTDSQKTALVTTSYNVPVGTATPVTINNRTRMTITATTSSETYIYTRPRKMLIDVNTPHGLRLLVEYKTGVSGASWQTLTDCKLSGWSGWNEIDFSSLHTFGGGPNQPSNNWYFRLTFYNVDKIDANYTSAKSSFGRIRLFGDTAWNIKTSMAKTGHLYSYDSNQNATFPANVTAEMFVGPLQGTAQFASSADTATTAERDKKGNIITDTYATKAALEVEANPSITIANFVGEDLTVSESINASTEAHNLVLEIHAEDSNGNDKLWKIEPIGASATQITPYDDLIKPFSSFLGSDVYDYEFSTIFASIGSDDISHSTLTESNESVDPTGLYCYPWADFPATSGSVLLENTAGVDFNTYYLIAVFYSVETKHFYFVQLGSFYGESNTNAHLSYSIVNGKLFIDSSSLTNSAYNCGGKRAYSVPEDLRLMTFGYSLANGFTDASSTQLYVSNADFSGCASCTSDYLEKGVEIEAGGTYLIPYLGKSASSDDPVINIYSPINANYSLSYLQDSGASAAVKHIRECNSKNFTAELLNVISSGRSDPTADTPGLFYFKHL